MGLRTFRTLGLEDVPSRQLGRLSAAIDWQCSSLPSEPTRALISRVLTQSEVETSDGAVLDRLTPREREVLTLVALGLSNEQIAQWLYISPTTAKTHVNRTMMKLGARDRAQLVIIAYETGVVRPGS